ncbi:MAG: ATP synthase F1 subunit epsilon [Bacteroidota bacterium]
MKITVLTPDTSVFEGEIKSVKVPGANGEFEVLNNHAPLVSALKQGSVRLVEHSGTAKSFKISSGFIEVLNNEIALLVQGYEA